MFYVETNVHVGPRNKRHISPPAVFDGHNLIVFDPQLPGYNRNL